MRLRKWGRSRVADYDTTYGHAKARVTKLAPIVKQLQRFLRTPEILTFTVMKVKRLICSVFIGCLYGISPGRKKTEPPTSIKLLSGLYHKTLKLVFRVGREKPVDKLIHWTYMPTWEEIQQRAMEVNYCNLRHPIKCSGKIIRQQTGTLGRHIARVRRLNVDHTDNM